MRAKILDANSFRWLGSSHWFRQTLQHLALVSQHFREHIAEELSFKLVSIEHVVHGLANARIRSPGAVMASYWGLRQRRDSHRIFLSLLHSIPGIQVLRHLHSVSWTMTLRDHFITQMKRLFRSVWGRCNGAA